MPAHAMPSRAANPMMWATGRATTASKRPVSSRWHGAGAGEGPDERPVAELDALGLAGRARRVEEGGDVPGSTAASLGERLGAVDLGRRLDDELRLAVRRRRGRTRPS